MLPSSRRSAAAAVGCGVLAVAVTAMAMVPTLRKADWSLTALPRVDSTTRLGAAARTLDPGFRTTHPGAYDGQFYWGVAIDPLATGRLPHDFDKASYRYGHPLYGWLAWLFSAGRARGAPAALAAVGLVSMFVAAAVAATLGRGRGRSGWEGLFVALNPGLITAATHDLGEPLAAALLLGAVLAYTRGRCATAWACLAFLPLAKEPLLLVLLAVVIWEVVQHRPKHAAAYATAAIPALLWWTYTRIHLGAWFTSGGSALAEPLAGWRRALVHTAGHGGLAHDVVVFILSSLTGLFVLATVRALRGRGPVELAYLALAAIVICLAPNATVAFSTALRNTAFLLVLVPFVIVSPRLLPRSRVRS